MIGLIFGPPGSGKGTQAAHVEREFKLSHLSTGDILRAEVARGTEIGKEAERIMRAGDLVPDDLIIRIVQGILRDPDVSSEVLLDGFPRTLEQANAFLRQSYIQEFNRKFGANIAIMGIQVVEGGEHRADSVQRALERVNPIASAAAEAASNSSSGGSSADSSSPSTANTTRTTERRGSR